MKVKINSFLLAMFFLEKEIILAIETKIKIPSVSFVFMIFFAFAIAINNKVLKLRMAKKPAAVMMALLCFVIISGFKNGYSNIEQYFKQFITFGLAALMFCLIEINYYYVISYLLRISAVFSLLYALVLRRGFQTLNDVVYGSVQMTIAYNFLPVVIVAIEYLFNTDRVKIKRYDVVYAWISLVIGSFTIFFDCFTRGAIIGILISLALIIVSRTNSKKALIYVSVGLIAAIIFVLNSGAILNWVRKTLDVISISIPAIDRAILLLSQDNLSSGRDRLYMYGLQEFAKSPITGHGLGYFEARHGVYVHNFLIELLYETGVVVTLIAMIYMCKQVYSDFIFVKHHKDYDLIVFRQILFLSSATPLIFSSTLWISTLVWLYVIYVACYKRMSAVHDNGAIGVRPTAGAAKAAI